MLRENLFDLHVTVTGSDGKKWSATFDKMTGGDVTSKETKYRPANGTTDQLALGGASEVTNIVVTRLYELEADHETHWLISQVGKAKMDIHKQSIDSNGVPFGSPLIYSSGRLNAVKPPPTDSQSDVAALFELEQSSVTPIA